MEKEEEHGGRNKSASVQGLTLQIIGFKQKDVTVVESETEGNPRGAAGEGVNRVL
jgi:hypothetical protein